jgi:hypothetical protein
MAEAEETLGEPRVQVPSRDERSRWYVRTSALLAGLVRHHRLDYGAGSMMYRVDLVVRANVDDEALHEVLIRANTYAIVEAVEATRDSGGDDCLVTARINAPGPIAALGSLLTVLSQTSEFPGLAEEGSLRRVAVEREEPLAAS